MHPTEAGWQPFIKDGVPFLTVGGQRQSVLRHRRDLQGTDHIGWVMEEFPGAFKTTRLVCAAVSVALLSACVATVQPVASRPPPPGYYAYPPPPPASSPAYYGPSNEDTTEWQASDAPPPLPDYEQPPCPEEGYLWTPGYWAFGQGGYYWVPGTWVSPPSVGMLWTPGYWGLAGPVYVFHAGYWGPHVGFYGGVHYGHGYEGAGYVGGRWAGNGFVYNRAVSNVNVAVVHNTYNETVINQVTVNRVSYNGGPAGIRAEATPDERRFAGERHVPPTSMQAQHIHEASSNPALFLHSNGGRPGIAATPRPAAFNAPGAIGARGASPIQPGSYAQPNANPPGSVPHPNPNVAPGYGGYRGPPPAAQTATPNYGGRGPAPTAAPPMSSSVQPAANHPVTAPRAPAAPMAPAKPQPPRYQLHPEDKKN
jgi:WXXGXW repeat (2 copies)